MKVRLSFTSEGIREFERDLLMWQVPKGKWVKRGNLYEGRLFEMRFDGCLELLGFKMKRIRESGRRSPFGNTIFNPDGLVIYAGFREKEGWRQVYSSCLHQSVSKTEVNRKTFSHSAARIKYQSVCECGADWTEWEWE